MGSPYRTPGRSVPVPRVARVPAWLWRALRLVLVAIVCTTPGALIIARLLIDDPLRDMHQVLRPQPAQSDRSPGR
jgi:hypothetical protein